MTIVRSRSTTPAVLFLVALAVSGCACEDPAVATPDGAAGSTAGTSGNPDAAADVSGSAGTTGAAGSSGAAGTTGAAGAPPVDPVLDQARRASIDVSIQALGKLAVAAEDPRHVVDCGTACPAPANTGGWDCSSVRYVEARAFDRFIVFQPNSSQLWPGNVLNGARAVKGELVPLAPDLAPVTFSVSLENITDSPTGMMQRPSLSSFREERNRILSTTLKGMTTAFVDYRIEDISSEPQLNFVLGASFPLRGILDITSGFDFTKTGKKSRVLLDFTQIYYTFDVDAPRRPADFFTSSLSAAALDGLLTKGEPPVYVQSIYFGRRILLAFESSDSTTTLHAAVKAAAEKLKIGGNVDAMSVTVLKRSSTKAVVIGGSGASAAMAVTGGLDAITSLIEMGGNYTQDSPGAPIAYQLAYLDNVPMKMVLASDYVDTTCTRTSATVRASLDGITNLSDDIGIGTEGEFYGTVRVVVPSATHDGSCPAPGATVDSISLMNYGTGMFYQPGETHEGTKGNLAIGAGKFICLEVRLLESDPGLVDDYGFAQKQLPWGEWEGTHTLQLRNATNAADVTVTLTLP